MKLKLIPVLIAMIAVAHAAPPTLSTGIPAFLDTDGDGTISEAERQAFVESREEASENGGAPAWLDLEGLKSEEGRQAAIAALRAKADERRAALFADAAGDDGLLSGDEFAALPAFENVPQETVERLFALFAIEEGESGVTMEAFLDAVRGGARPMPPNRPGRPTPPAPPEDGEDEEDEEEEEVVLE